MIENDNWDDYDITFCSYKDCKNKECRRHPSKLNGWLYPVSMSNFEKCNNWKDGKHRIFFEEVKDE